MFLLNKFVDVYNFWIFQEFWVFWIFITVFERKKNEKVRYGVLFQMHPKFVE